MLLFIHLVIALAGMTCTTYLYFKPSATTLRTSYALLAGTLLSGTYLVVSTGGHLIEACMAGLLYTGAIALGIVSARRKLADQKVRKIRD